MNPGWFSAGSLVLGFGKSYPIYETSWRLSHPSGTYEFVNFEDEIPFPSVSGKILSKISSHVPGKPPNRKASIWMYL